MTAKQSPPAHHAGTHNSKPASTHKHVKHSHKKLPKLPKLPPTSSQFSPSNERDVAMNLAASVHKRFENLVKATILFGSQAKKTAKPSSDIDVIIIIDDASINWDLELVAWYREELGKILAQNKHSHELHVNTIKLTTWWQDLIYGDPVVLNILRYGEALIDIGGFFNPIKALLLQGRIHATPEAVYTALQRAPSHLARSKAAELGALEGVYWTMVDSAQAALMTAGLLPPSPEHITMMLKENFVDKNMIRGELVTWYRDIYALHKAMDHGHVREIRGADIDVWQQRAETFLKKMTEVIDQILQSKG